jgi:hypothetical protein
MPVIRAYMAVCDDCLSEGDAVPPDHTTHREYAESMRSTGWVIKRGTVLCPLCAEMRKEDGR